MKILVISDIHGDFDDFYKIMLKETFDEIIILGDLMDYGYHINDDIIDLLVSLKDKLILIKGNTDFYIDYEKYGLYAHDIIKLNLNGKLVTLTHGNVYNMNFLPNDPGELFFFGHTHVPFLSKNLNITFFNPGSLGHPRGGSESSYGIFDEDKLIIKNLSGKIIKEMNI